MSKSHQRLWFAVIATAVFSIFMTLLVVVGLLAHVKQSGRTGLDMATLQLMRSKTSSSIPLP